MQPLAVLIGALSLTISSLCLATSAHSGYVAVEKLSNVPSGWRQVRRASPSKLIKFRLAVYQESAAEFEQKVIDISTPGHHTYGQHMSLNYIRDLLRPDDSVSDSILSWLAAENVPSDTIDDHGGWITFTVPISQAESLLHTRFYDFYNKNTGSTVTRTLQYSVPDSIHPYVHLIQPTTRFGNFRPQAGISDLSAIFATTEDLSADCSFTITPTCLRDLYQVNDSKTKPDPRNRLGISGFLEEYARYSDFRTFMEQYGPGLQDANFSVTTINGGLNLQNSSHASSEASLDIQYAASMAYNALTTYYSTAGRGPLVPEISQPDPNNSDNEPYLEQLHYLLNLPSEELPAVLSTSYGEDEQSVPKSYAIATCNLFAQLGARGVSVIFSSGDSGVGGPCVSNENNSTKFQPAFPASCPFVTSVGGTYGINPEKAVDFSGGGFSQRFRRPSYQDSTVGKYAKQLGNRWAGYYNPDGRGIPDVAAQAKNFLIVDHGSILKIGGTSASAPAFAGIVSRLNAARLENNKPRLGFLNPWLYSLNQTGFTDIVHGASVGCTESIGHVPDARWNATTGWDPATGLGTPLYSELVKMAAKL